MPKLQFCAAFFAVTILAMTFGCSGGSGSSQSQTARKVDLDQFLAAHPGNKAAFDSEYKDRWIEISGKVISVSGDSGRYTVRVGKDGNEILFLVVVELDRSQGAAAASLKQKQTITVVGKVTDRDRLAEGLIR